MSKIKLAVIIEEGMVQAIISDTPEFQNMTVQVIDYDIEGSLEDECMTILQSDHKPASAYVSTLTVEPAQIQIIERIPS